MAQDEMLLFRGRNRIRYGYASLGLHARRGQNVARRRRRGRAGRHHHPHARLWAGRRAPCHFRHGGNGAQGGAKHRQPHGNGAGMCA